MKKHFWLPVIFLALLSGCASKKNLYYWGEYESILLDMYTDPGSADNYTQINKLSATVQQAKLKDMQVPPGLYAHLGMIYAKEGDMSSAIAAFKEEKNLYPESAAFIDGMLNRAGAK